MIFHFFKLCVLISRNSSTIDFKVIACLKMNTFIFLQKNRQNNDNEDDDDDDADFNNDEESQAEEFILAETQGTIEAIVNDRSSNNEIDTLLMPPPGSSKMKTNNPTPAGLGKIIILNFFVKLILKQKIREIDLHFFFLLPNRFERHYSRLFSAKH